MFHNLQLTTTIAADRQTRYRNAATRSRLVRRNRAPAAAGPPAAMLSVIWPDDPDYLPTSDRATCAA